MNFNDVNEIIIGYIVCEMLPKISTAIYQNVFLVRGSWRIKQLLLRLYFLVLRPLRSSSTTRMFWLLWIIDNS